MAAFDGKPLENHNKTLAKDPKTNTFTQTNNIRKTKEPVITSCIAAASLQLQKKKM